MPESPLRVAVWGLGPHALRNVIPSVVQTPGLELRGVLSRDRATVARTAAQHDCGSWPSPESMLDDVQVDVVYLSTPIALHHAQGLATLRAGKHLWCEKALTVGAREARELADASRESGRVLAEAFMYLHHPHFAALRRLVHGGRIGDLHSIACRFGIPRLERPGFRDDPSLGGGAFLDVGSYPVSALLALLPAADVSVSHARIDLPRGARVDAGGIAVLEPSTGGRACLEWAVGAAYRNEIDVWGSAGAVWTNRLFSKAADFVPILHVRDLRGDVVQERLAPANHFVAMLDAFAGLTRDADAAEHERREIVRRAQLLDAIRARAAAPPGA